MNDYRFSVWAQGGDSPEPGRCFVHDTDALQDELTGYYVVAGGAEAGRRIDELLAAGAEQVLLGEAALRDSALVREAIARHGKTRIGVWLPVRRAAVRWGFDTQSNADFSTVSVTNPVPRWVVCSEDGTPTDVDACWWAGEMIAAGCDTVLVSVDAPEDDDLLACAEMAEVAGEHFWLDPGSDETEELRFWLRYGQARQLVLPAGCDTTATRMSLEQRLTEKTESAACQG